METARGAWDRKRGVWQGSHRCGQNELADLPFIGRSNRDRRRRRSRRGEGGPVRLEGELVERESSAVRSARDDARAGRLDGSDGGGEAGYGRRREAAR